MEKTNNDSIRGQINSLGFNIPENTECWKEDDSLYFRVGEPDDVTGYVTEINTDYEAYRTIGNSEGSFATEWKNYDGSPYEYEEEEEIEEETDIDNFDEFLKDVNKQADKISQKTQGKNKDIEKEIER